MNLAEKIELVLHYAAIDSKECPRSLRANVSEIKARYSELKKTESFAAAARIARVEYIDRELGKLKNKVHSYYRD